MRVNSINSNITLVKKGVTSGGSRSFFRFEKKLPLKSKIKKLMIKVKNNAGRNNLGSIVLNTRKTQCRNFPKPVINNRFRILRISFIANYVFIPKQNKLISLLVLSCGSITFVQASVNHELFTLTRFKSVVRRKWNFHEKDIMMSSHTKFRYDFHTLGLLPKNKPISLIEPLPGQGIKYTKSTGSSAKTLKMNSLTGTALVKLPSGVKKVFSTYSIASLGGVALPNQKKCKVNKAGFMSNFGKKSIVRGVAKNPVDHPHGGRNKAIKYQRTPWGTTTKYK